jgi:hypothetical protein
MEQGLGGGVPSGGSISPHPTACQYANVFTAAWQNISGISLVIYPQYDIKSRNTWGLQ